MRNNMDLKLLKDLHCDQCSLQFDKKCEFDNHLASMNHGIEKKKKPVTLRNQSHQAKKPIHCEICEAGFQSKHGLKIHEESVHDRKKLPYARHYNPRFVYFLPSF